MKERPIAFTDGLVDLVVDGSKTQTRRALGRRYLGDRWRLEKLEGAVAHMRHPEHGLHRVRCPYGGPGDTLWIRQGWKTPEAWDHLSPTDFVETWSDALERAPIMLTSNGRRIGDWLPLQADALADSTPGRVRAPMHLPHALAVHRVTVASLRVEPVTSISEADAKAEGVDVSDSDLGILQTMAYAAGAAFERHTSAFFSLWDEINHRRGLGIDAKPWTWVIEMSNPRTR
jgi:hypothetical protein